MNKIIKRVVATLVATTFLLKLSVAGFAAGQAEESKVDMAYPQQVEQNAQAELQRALTEGDGLGVTRSVLQISAARCVVSTDTIVSAIAMIDSLVADQPSDIRSLLYLSEAMLYHKIYNYDSYKYNQRTTTETMPDDCRQWSRRHFAQKILDLTSLATADSELLINRPIGNYKSVLAGLNSEQELFYPTLYDMVTYNAIELLSSFTESMEIPFGKSDDKPDPSVVAEKRIKQLIDSLVRLHAERGEVAAEIKAIIEKSKYVDDSKDYNELMLEGYEKYSHSEYSAEFLLEVRELGEKRADVFLQKCQDYLQRFAESYRSDAIREIVKSLTEPTAELHSMRYYYMLKDDVDIEVDYKNIEQFVVEVYAINPNFDGKSFHKLKKSDLQLLKADTVLVRKDRLTAINSIKKVNLGQMDYSTYMVRVLTKYDNPSDFNLSKYHPFVVTDMSAIYMSDIKKDCRLYVVNADTGKPMEGVTVRTSSNNLTTDAEGSVSFRGNNKVNYTLINGKDKVSDDFYVPSNYGFKRGVRYEIMTDLPIYHPGDTVRFVIVAYNDSINKLNHCAGHSDSIELYGADGMLIEKTSFTTDSLGRACGQYVLPSDGVRGTFQLRIANKYESHSFQVEDYKTPTFYVEIDDLMSEMQVGDKLVVSGKALTYSGMPLSDAEVSVDISYVGWWRAQSNASHTEKTVTDASGQFRIELDTDGLKGTTFARGCYAMTATVTSEAGETQKSKSRRFAIGKAYRIDTSEVEPKIRVDAKNITLPLKVMSIMDSPVNKEVKYQLVNAESEVVREGVFMSPTLSLSVGNIPSAEYKLKLMLLSDSTVVEEKKVQLYRAKDKRPPIATALWLPRNYITPVGEYCDVEVMTSYKDANILCVISDAEKIVDSYWLKGKKNKYTFRVASPKEYECVRISFYAVYNSKTYTDEVTILPSDQLKIKTTSFRDKLTSGQSESWRFQFSYKNQPVGNIPVIASMIDASLCSIKEYELGIPIYTYFLRSYQGGIMYQSNYLNMGSMWYDYPQVKFANPPMLNFYGQIKSPNVSNRGGLFMAHSESVIVTEDAMDEVVVAYGTASRKSLHSNAYEAVEFKEPEHPSAFFMTDLVTDENGEVELTFDVPNYDTTWKLNLLGYMPNMKSAVFTDEIVSSKPIMVRSNLPRFVRTGDVIRLKSTVSNSTDSVAQIGVGIRILDEVTGEVLTTLEAEIALIEPKSSEVYGIDFEVPDTAASLVYEVYAFSINNGFSDGERARIAVLPSSTPVVESVPFYLNAGQTEFSYQLGEDAHQGKMTLMVCDNPIWECVTALPSIARPTSSTVTGLTTALVANATADGIARRFPQVREALSELMAEQPVDSISALQSSLEVNGDLKVTDLDNTIWQIDARNETSRMQNLSTILNADKNAVLIRELTERIGKLQSPSGGWCWYSGAQPSVYLTTEVLGDLALLIDMDFLDRSSGLRLMISKGIDFVEADILDSYNKSKKFSTLALLRYLFIKSNLKVGDNNKQFAELKPKALNAIKSEWKEFGIYDKAMAAILLSREGFNKESLQIIESLRQYAIRTEHRGAYYDNLRYGYSKLSATAWVLMAFHEIAPSDGLVDELRQWLLIQRQAQNWGDNSETLHVVYAILTTGSDWISERSRSQVWIGAQQYEPTKREELTGSYRIDLENVEGQKIYIKNDGDGPWWGSVVSQYVAPIVNVKAASIDDLSISKEILLIDGDNAKSVEPGETLKVGQKVRVQLIVVAKRDMEYVVVKDGRSACLEPADQTSGTVWQDGVMAYREVRKAETNLMITHLPKGTHVLSYDCYVSQEGDFSLGIVVAQCLYAPSLVAHSGGKLIEVK